jgi:predicted MFS family arabinose efflux permease
VILLFALLGLVTVVLGTIETLATEVSFANNHTGGSGTGLLLAATGAGLLAGAPLAGIIVRRATERAAMRAGSVIAGMALVASGASLGLAWSLMAFALVGVGMQTVLVAGWLLLHRHVCRSNTGAVFGVLESQQLVGNAVGAACAGAAMGHVGVWPVVVVAAVGLPTAMLSLSADRVRRLSSSTTVIGASAAAHHVASTP